LTNGHEEENEEEATNAIARTVQSAAHRATRYVRTRAEVDDAIIAAHPDRTISNAYRDALEAWVKFRAYFAANPPNNPELDRLIGEVVL